MTNRRDLLFGAAGLAAAGTAYGLRPRKKLSLLGSRKIEDVVPAAFGPWTSQLNANLIQPTREGSLAARLYSQTMTRLYYHQDTGEEVMMLVAYGENQSDLLQLHRPEACYPAVGFRILTSRAKPIPLRNGASLPGREVTAARSDRSEHIVYWTRLGEYLPVDAGDQRNARLRTAMQGFVADGGLFRCSKIGEDAEASFRDLDGFVSTLLSSVAPAALPALVGTKISKTLIA